MELNKTLELLKTFVTDNKIQSGAVNLLETMIKNNVSADDAPLFCQEHFMSANIADYYVKFYDYVVSVIEEENKAQENTSTLPLIADIPPLTETAIVIELKEINNTLKELTACLKQLM
jgi:hypothetical protein